MIAALPGAAAAEPNIGPLVVPKGLFLPVGINLGGALHPSIKGGSGFLFGGEVSAVYHSHDPHPLWAGGYVDVLRDFGAGSTRFSIGPEFGWAFVGIDAGYLGQIRKGVYHHGFVGRFMLSIGLVTAYARWGHLFDDPTERNFGEFGALLKFPIPLRTRGRSWFGAKEPEPPPQPGLMQPEFAPPEQQPPPQIPSEPP
jgi:hypothetical protein